MLKPLKTISSPAWMRDGAVRRLMAVLNKEQPDKALFVGGCVRNTLLGLEVEDIDLATVYRPEQVQKLLIDAGVKVVPTGLDHGTVSAVIKGKAFEITTLRRDMQTDGRHAVVAFTDDWSEDARRRDFTMNTLLADERGNIYDPTGQGIKDLEARAVKFVGEPETRIREDYLRILRFFRFHAMYGRGGADDQALAACRKFSEKIYSLSRERITQEFFKIISVDKPVDVLEILNKNKILDKLFSPEYDPVFLRHLCEFQNRYALSFLSARLFVFAGLSLGNIKDMQKFLLFPKVFLKDIEAISRVLALPDLDRDHAVKAAIYRNGRVPTAQALMIELVQDRVMNGYAPAALEIIQSWDVPDFPISGEDLMRAGYKPGPALGKKLAELESRWIEQGFPEDFKG